MAQLGLTATELGAARLPPARSRRAARAARRVRAQRSSAASCRSSCTSRRVRRRQARRGRDRRHAQRRRRRRVRRRRGDGRRLVARPSPATHEQHAPWPPTSPRSPRCVAGHGLTFALHPHAGTLVESAADVERLLATTDVGWCLDTGHLLIGGGDPAAFVRDHPDRVVHVHLKDVDAAVAARYRAGELTLMGATQAGLFRPSGQGDAGIAEVLDGARRQRVRALARARAGRRHHR